MDLRFIWQGTDSEALDELEELTIAVPKAFMESRSLVEIGLYAWVNLYVRQNMNRQITCKEILEVLVESGEPLVNQAMLETIAQAAAQYLDDVNDVEDQEAEEEWDEAERQWAEHVATRSQHRVKPVEQAKPRSVKLPPIDGPTKKGIHVVYRHFDLEDKLLYVGVSNDVLARSRAHAHSRWFNRIARIAVEEFPSRAEAIRAECNALIDERPECNVARQAHKGDQLLKKELAE